MHHQTTIWPDPDANPPASLDPPETTVEPDAAALAADTYRIPHPDDLLRETWRHRGWLRLRRRIHAALIASVKASPILLYDPEGYIIGHTAPDNPPPSSNRLNAFRTCGTECVVQQHRDNPDRLRILPLRCHDRFCLPCARARAASICARLAERLPNHPIRMITLTQRAKPETLTASLDRLYRSFRRLRASNLWRSSVKGGVAFTEITRNAETRAWHVHVHVLCEGAYIPQPSLSAAWLTATGDSNIVDIRLARQTRQALTYVTKYVTKPIHASVLTHHPSLVEYITAMQGRRTIIALGSWVSWRLTRQETTGDWQAIGYRGEWLTGLFCGFDHHEAITEFVRQCGSLDRITEVHLLPQGRSPPA